MKIGVLPLGYYEGIPRELSNKGFFTVDNNELPIVGRVCMNHTMIDLKDSTTNVGDEVIVISDNPENINSIAQICVLNHLFNYSLMTGLSDSTRRVIIK
jgi:alanine racemase